jgi:D-proline reductase (dithiol) PrdB
VDERPDTAHRVFVSYIDKSREFYAAQGYDRPYRWAYHDSSPFTPLTRPLNECRIGLVTTASPWSDEPDAGRTSDLGGAYALPVQPPPARMFTDHRSWDKDATHTNDVETFLPIGRLAEFARSGRIASPSPRFYGMPTEYSQRRTRESDAPRILELMREDGVDAAILVAL